MATIPPHTHTFEIPTATTAEILAGVETGKAVTPDQLLPALDVVAVPAGGATGQILGKVSDADNAVQWQNAGAGDVLSINNLSDLASVRTARAILNPDTVGVSETPDEFDTDFRFGKICYSRGPNGSRVITDFSEHYPPGAFMTPGNDRGATKWVEIPNPPWEVNAAVGDPLVNTGYDGRIDNSALWDRLNWSILDVVDVVTGKQWTRYDGSSFDYTWSKLTSTPYLRLRLPNPDEALTGGERILMEIPAVGGFLGGVYVDPVNGSDDENDGRSADQPLATMDAAETVAIAVGAAFISRTAGRYFMDEKFGGWTGGDIAILCPTGLAWDIAADNDWADVAAMGWAADGTYPQVQVALAISGGSTPTSIADFDQLRSDGHPTVIYTNAGSVAACAATENTFYFDGGTRDLYVHLPAGAAVDATQTFPLRSLALTITPEEDAKVYIENMRYLSGGNNITHRGTTGITTLVCKNVHGVGSSGGNCWDIRAGNNLLIDSGGSQANNDIFNYTRFSALDIPPHVVNINGYASDARNSGTGNAETGHDEVKFFSIGLTGAHTDGPGIAIVDECHAYVVDAVFNDTRYGLLTGNEARMWVDGYAVTNTRSDVAGVSAGGLPGGVIARRNGYSTTGEETTNGGTLEDF